MNLINLNVSKIEINLKKGFFTIKFDNEEELVCRLVKDLNNGGYRRAINLNALGMYAGKPLRKNDWLQTPGHNQYENWDDIIFVIAREARLLGLPIL